MELDQICCLFVSETRAYLDIANEAAFWEKGACSEISYSIAYCQANTVYRQSPRLCRLLPLVDQLFRLFTSSRKGAGLHGLVVNLSKQSCSISGVVREMETTEYAYHSHRKAAAVPSFTPSRSPCNQINTLAHARPGTIWRSTLNVSSTIKARHQHQSRKILLAPNL